MQNRNIIRRYPRKKNFPISGFLFILLCLLFLCACDSSDTRSTAKSATSSATELQVRITSPSDGSTMGFTVKAEGEDATADIDFSFATSGGTEPVTVTWLIDGPNGYSNSSSGDNVLFFIPAGKYTITAVARDAKGLTASDSITIDVW